MSKHRGSRGVRRGNAGLILVLMGSFGCVMPAKRGSAEPPNVVTEPAPPLLVGRAGRGEDELSQDPAAADATAALDAARAAGEASEPVPGEGGEDAPDATGDENGEPSAERLKVEAQRVLDDWHRAAALGDELRYLGHFALDGVFMGPAPGERSDLATFSSFVRSSFAAGKNWAIEPVDRHLVFGPGMDVAWFDETLKSGQFSITRGTGVLRREENTWKIALYSMTYTVPTSIAGEVTDAIKAVARPR